MVVGMTSDWLQRTLPWATNLVGQLRNLLIILALAIVVDRLLRALEAHTIAQREEPARAPAQTLFRWLRLANWGLALVLLLGTLANVQVAWLLAAVGIVATAGSIVFGDLIYNAFAQVMLKSQRLVSVGDWLEIPPLQINGEVKEVGSVVIVIQNWDNTLTTVPPRYLLNNSFRNWQQMHRTGRRRIMRTLKVDVSTVRPLDDELVARARGVPAVAAFLDRAPAPDEAPLDLESKTNAAFYRAYLMGYLAVHPLVAKDMIWRVGNEDAVGNGLPLVLLAYLTTTQELAYRLAEAEIYEHALAVAPHFGLRIFQSPTGADLRQWSPAAEEA
jgi:miniconductance mechanosensitive channel